MQARQACFVRTTKARNADSAAYVGPITSGKTYSQSWRGRYCKLVIFLMSVFDSPRLQYAFCIILSGTSWQVERQACHCHLASLLLGSNPWDKSTLLHFSLPCWLERSRIFWKDGSNIHATRIQILQRGDRTMITHDAHDSERPLWSLWSHTI